MTATDESGRRLAEALQARATGAGGRGTGPRLPGRSGTSTSTALLLALLGGGALGTAFALVSLLAPGVLPPLG